MPFIRIGIACMLWGIGLLNVLCAQQFFTAFSAFRVEVSKVRLEWQITAGTDYELLSVERSTDTLIWEVLNVQPGARADGQRQSYTNGSPFIGKSFYRLRIEKNGASFYSPVKALFVTPLPQIETTLYPNPSVDWVIVAYNGGGDSYLLFRVLTLSGNVMEERLLDNRNVLGSIRLDVSDWAPGGYLMEISGEYDVSYKLLWVRDDR